MLLLKCSSSTKGKKWTSTFWDRSCYWQEQILIASEETCFCRCVKIFWQRGEVLRNHWPETYAASGFTCFQRIYLSLIPQFPAISACLDFYLLKEKGMSTTLFFFFLILQNILNKKEDLSWTTPHNLLFINQNWE